MDWRLKELLDKLRAAGFEVDSATGVVTMTGINVEDATVSGEFDTSNGGTQAGVWIDGPEVRIYDSAGVRTLKIYSHADGKTRLLGPAGGGGFSPLLVLDENGDITLQANTSGASGDVEVITNNFVVAAGGVLGAFAVTPTYASVQVPLTAYSTFAVGSSGTPVKDRRRFVINYNPASVAANTSTFFDISLGVTLPGASNSEWTTAYIAGLHNNAANQLSFSAAALTAAMDTVRLYVTNPHAAAVDLGARDFNFICERWA